MQKQFHSHTSLTNISPSKLYKIIEELSFWNAWTFKTYEPTSVFG